MTTRAMAIANVSTVNSNEKSSLQYSTPINTKHDSNYKLKHKFDSQKAKTRLLQHENMQLKRKLVEYEEQERIYENLKQGRLYSKRHRSKKKRSAHSGNTLHPTSSYCRS